MKTLLVKMSLLAILVPFHAYSADTCSAVFGNLDSSGNNLYRKYQEGLNEDHLFRSGPVNSHTYINNNKPQKPYFFVALPEGNTGFGMWFTSSQSGAKLRSLAPPKALVEGALHGTEIELMADATSLRVDRSILSSMRFVRDQELEAPVPDRIVNHSVTVEGRTILMRRQSLNKDVDYLMKVEVLDDTQILREGNEIRLSSNTKVRFKVSVFTNEKPLTPLPLKELFEEKFLDAIGKEQRDLISFLLYKEKLMAGSPRYQTKFGRDTLISLRVFLKHAKPEGLETLLIASLSSAHPKTGQTSHEQHEGEIASWERIKKHKKVVGVKDPIEDYNMIDDDFMLANLLLSYMKMHPKRVEGFLNGRDGRNLPIRDLVVNNFKFVIKSTQDFAQNPVYKNLIRLKPGHSTGQWRDSEIGLGGGVYPFDVNTAIVPGTLKLMAEIYGERSLEFYNPAMAEYLGRATQVWSTKALPLFMVQVPAAQIKASAEGYMKVLGFDARHLPPAPKEDIVFPAVSLREDGSPVPIMHSDDSMMSTYGHPPVKYLENMAKVLSTPFPYGLHTDSGLVVANAVFAAPELQKRFTPKNYHGLVSWGREENLLVFGISRILERQDLQPQLRQKLTKLQKDIGRLVVKKGGIELVAIVQKNGQFVAEPFAGDALPNIDQFWNHLIVVSRHLLLNGNLPD